MRALQAMGVRSILLTSGTLSPLGGFAQELQLPFPVQLENPHVVDPKQVGAPGQRWCSPTGSRTTSHACQRVKPPWGVERCNQVTSPGRGMLQGRGQQQQMWTCAGVGGSAAGGTGRRGAELRIPEPRHAAVQNGAGPRYRQSGGQLPRRLAGLLPLVRRPAVLPRLLEVQLRLRCTATGPQPQHVMAACFRCLRGQSHQTSWTKQSTWPTFTHALNRWRQHIRPHTAAQGSGGGATRSGALPRVCRPVPLQAGRWRRRVLCRLPVRTSARVLLLGSACCWDAQKASGWYIDMRRDVFITAKLPLTVCFCDPPPPVGPQGQGQRGSGLCGRGWPCGRHHRHPLRPTARRQGASAPQSSGSMCGDTQPDTAWLDVSAETELWHQRCETRASVSHVLLCMLR